MEGSNKNVVLNLFRTISKIPRKSGNEEKIADYLENFAKQRNLEYNRDKNNNVIIIKEASKGYEKQETIILQSHTDMICEKIEGCTHDFEKDGIDVYIDGDYLKARGTTLGADNGIGVAITLAILDDRIIRHPRIEAIFTTEEETTMNGVKNIDTQNIKGSKMICLDNMSEEELWIGSASHTVIKHKLKGLMKQNIDNEYSVIGLTLSGLLGGHSGIDIDKNRGNSIKMMVGIIRSIQNEMNILIKSINAKGKENVIPRECTCEIAIKKEDLIKFKQKMEIIRREIKSSQLENAENIELTYIIAENKELDETFDSKSTKQIIDIINDIPNGVYHKAENGKTLVSLNIGIIETDNSDIKIVFSIRSNRELIKDELKNKIEQIKYNYNIEETISCLLGYEHKIETEFIKKCKEIYISNFNREPKLVDMHVGLEAGFFNAKIPNLDFIAIAPNIYNAHSPQEKCSISSIERVYKYLLDILETK